MAFYITKKNIISITFDGPIDRPTDRESDLLGRITPNKESLEFAEFSYSMRERIFTIFRFMKKILSNLMTVVNFFDSSTSICAPATCCFFQLFVRIIQFHINIFLLLKSLQDIFKWISLFP